MNDPTEDDGYSKDALISLSGDSVDLSLLGDADSASPIRQVRYTTWGIFEVAYEPKKFSAFRSLFFAKDSSASSIRHHFLPFLRLLKELWDISKWLCVEYYLYTAWLAVAPALTIYIAYLVIFNIEMISYQVPTVKEEKAKSLQALTLVWLICGLVSNHVENMLIESRVKMGGALRAHFIPRLVQASLEWETSDLQENSRTFPYAHDYGDFIPGWDFFHDSFTRLRHAAVIALEIIVVAIIFSQQETTKSSLLISLTSLFLITTIFTPSNGVGGAGYTFWTKNPDYNRLMVLFNIVFDPEYRATLRKDGLGGYLCEEYNKSSKSLGAVKADTWILGWHIPAPWYWGMAEACIVSSPMALCAIVFLSSAMSSGSLIAMMAIFQYSVTSMRQGIENVKHDYEKEPLLETMARVKKFYDILDETYTSNKLTLLAAKAAPQRHFKGAKITLENVCYQYQTAEQNLAPNAINNVTLKIESGQLIVIAGANGSGKTTLVKLLSGLFYPTEGEALIDDEPLSSYDTKSLRQTAVFVGQSEAIYPVSLRENILMGLTQQSQRERVTDADVEQAARLGGAWDLIKRLGYDTILNPCSVVCYSIQECPGRAATEALKRNSPSPIPIPISSGERQRLIASRAFMRAKHGDTKLIILDEPSNALDTIAERDVLNNFRQIARENGQTLIVVTHRLASVAKYADHILCMENGKLAEQGTHVELLASGRAYSFLYKAQIIKD